MAALLGQTALIVNVRVIQLPALAWSIGEVINGPITRGEGATAIASMGVLLLAASGLQRRSFIDNGGLFIQHQACRLLGPKPGDINVPIPTSVSLGQTSDE